MSIADVQVVNSQFTLEIPVDSVFTLSTRDSIDIPDQGEIPAETPFPLPYYDDFQGDHFNSEFRILQTTARAKSQNTSHLRRGSGRYTTDSLAK